MFHFLKRALDSRACNIPTYLLLESNGSTITSENRGDVVIANILSRLGEVGCL